MCWIENDCVRVRKLVSADVCTANWEQAQSSFFTFNPLDFAHFCRANDQIDAKGKQLATTAANKALMLQACPPATSSCFLGFFKLIPGPTWVI